MDSSSWTGFTTSLFTPHSLKRLNAIPFGTLELQDDETHFLSTGLRLAGKSDVFVLQAATHIKFSDGRIGDLPGQPTSQADQWVGQQSLTGLMFSGGLPIRCW